MSEPSATELPIPRCIYLIRDDNTFLFFNGLTVDQAIEAIRKEDAYWTLSNRRNGTYLQHTPLQDWEVAARALFTEPLKERHVEDGRTEGAESFRDAVIDALVNLHIYTTEHDTDPRKAIADLIETETNIALDPAVSSNARALIDRGRKIVPSWWKCSVHGPGKREAWGCPDCVWELKRENARLREALTAERNHAAQIREQISSELTEALNKDLEYGVHWRSEHYTEEFKRNYPALWAALGKVRNGEQTG